MDGSGLTGSDEPVTLSTLEFDVLWTHLSPGAMPLAVKVPSPGQTHSERAELELAAWAGIAAKGLGRQVELNPDIEDLFTLIARPDREVDGRIWAGGDLRLLACSAGTDAVLATLVADRVTLRRISSDALVSEAVGVLPALPAGPGRSVTLPTDDFEAAASGNLAAGLTQRGIREDDATALAAMITPLRGTGNFGVAVRDRLGRRRRADRVVSFFDTDQGRYLQVRRDTPDRWTTITPADNRRLGQHLGELLDETTA